MAGIRDLNTVESALNRASNLDTYGIATSQRFSDGNKRTAWVIGRLFLAINGQTFAFSKVDAINFMLAARNMTELQAAEWIRQRLVTA